MSRARVLVVDDKENALRLFEKILGETFDVVTTTDGTHALALIEASDFDVLISDIRMPRLDGRSLLRATKAVRPEVEVILVTAYGTVADAVDSMREGAYHYLTKPLDPDQALLIVERAAERKRLREQARDLRSALDEARSFDNLVGKAASMQRVFTLMERAANTNATVLLTGESGTGKELVARAIHRAGPRCEHRFVPINCGAIPENLVEAELFGHLKGTFTGALGDRRGLFEEAHLGTLFLDEIADLPLPVQVKLNRALQERAIRRVGSPEEVAVDVRVICATNQDLRKCVADGTFREDLFYRLNVFPISLPPLRDRREDIPAIAGVLLERHRSAVGVGPSGFTPEALSALLRHEWPGNVRELENAIERAMAVCIEDRIREEDLPEDLAHTVRSRPALSSPGELSYREFVEMARDRASRDYLAALLRQCEGNVTRASSQAGIKRESFHRLLKQHGLHSDDYKSQES